MADFEPDNYSRSEAARFSELYIDFLQKGIQSDNEESLSEELRANKIMLEDVSQHMTTLNVLVKVLRRIDERIPCLRVEDSVIPINLFNYIDDSQKLFGLLKTNDLSWIYDHPFPYYESLHRVIRRLDQEKHLEIVNTNSLFEYTRRNLMDFLSYRIAGFFGSNPTNSNRSGAGGGTGGGGGRTHKPTPSKPTYLAVTLNTKHTGLQIEASPSLFLSWSYFGHPTTPLKGQLLPGSYLFGGKGPSLPTFTHDPTIVKIPPNLKISLHGI